MAHEWAMRVTKKEYAVVFPDYFFGQIEAKHQPGAFALPAHVVWDLLDATCDEIGRNGFKKILIVHEHGGNPELLKYFIETRLERRREYVVYRYDPNDKAFNKSLQKLRKSGPDQDCCAHAGEDETSEILFLRPELVQLDRANQESGKNLNRLPLPDLFTSVYWYAQFPNHYAGTGAVATREIGRSWFPSSGPSLRHKGLVLREYGGHSEKPAWQQSRVHSR